MELWNHQKKAVDMLFDYMRKNKDTNPALSLPGGSGKSVVIAHIVQQAMQQPDRRVLMLVHSKELVRQNYEALRAMWPGAPVGIYCAALNQKVLNEPIIYAGIQSIRSKAAELDHIDLVLVDEAHSINNKQQGKYRALLNELKEINPKMRIIGFTASPYRVGAGLLTDGEDALFHNIIEPVSIEELVNLKKLSPLRSKNTEFKLDMDGINKNAGEYVMSDMQEKFDNESNNSIAVKEIKERAAGRKHWLVFCSGVEHAQHMAESFNEQGITSDYVTGKDTPSVRDEKIRRFESGEIRALCNVGILTTGYNFKPLDCVVLLRGTTSPGLYLQIVVRGMRISEGKEDCLVLDFCNNVRTHGPVTNITPPPAPGQRRNKEETPMKACEQCHELLFISVMTCPCCGFQFERQEKRYTIDDERCIMGNDGPPKTTMKISSWKWSVHTSKKTGKDMLKTTYRGSMVDPRIEEYFGFDERSVQRELVKMVRAVNGPETVFNEVMGEELEDIARFFNVWIRKPMEIDYERNGKFYTVRNRRWFETQD